MSPKIPLNPSQKAIVAIAIVTGVLCATAVMLRVLARHISNRKLISSDYIIIPACLWNPDFSASPPVFDPRFRFTYHVPVTGLCCGLSGTPGHLYVCTNHFLPSPSWDSKAKWTNWITTIYEVGLGAHLQDVIRVLGPETVIGFSKVHIATVTATPPSVQLTDLPLLAQILFSVQLIYTISISLTKLSILELYRQIFPTRVMAVICFGVQALVILWALVTVLPLAYNWDTTIEGGRCGDTLVSWKSTGIVNILTDVFVLVIPVYDLSQIQMALYKRVVLIATFTLGIL
ncbi:hypothetical protein PG989_000064 [Apiospora arundinis]